MPSRFSDASPDPRCLRTGPYRDVAGDLANHCFSSLSLDSDQGVGVSGVSVLFLAGGPIQPPLQRGMGFPVAGLPLDSSRTLLAAWLDAVDLCVGERQSSTLLLCSSSADSEWFSAELRRAGRGSGSVEVRLDARPHRGVCGLIADTAAASPLAEWLLLVELNTLSRSRCRRFCRRSRLTRWRWWWG